MAKVINLDEYRNTKDLEEIAEKALEAYKHCITNDEELKKDISKTACSIREATPDNGGLCNFDSSGFITAFTHGFIEGWYALGVKLLQESKEHTGRSFIVDFPTDN